MKTFLNTCCAFGLLLSACSDSHALDADASDVDGGPELVPDAPSSAIDAEGSDSGATGDPCADAGAMRTIDCGACGTRAQRCGSSMTWEDASACLMQGECMAGAVEMRTTDACGEETRICSATCGWGEWERTRDDGVCARGATRRSAEGCPAGARTEVCTDECVWGPPSECTDNCGDFPRETPGWAREVCIPSDTLRYGVSGARIDARLSAFYLDVYPVTNRRYASCVAAGACSVPSIRDVRGVNIYDEPSRIDHPVGGVTWSQAVAFCAWDDDRVLPTEAQWELAYRGPAPRENAYPWDFGSPCDHDSPCTPPPVMIIADRHDALPWTLGYSGTYMQYGGGWEWTSNWYAPDHPSAGATMDPTGPSSGTFHTLRGEHRTGSSTLDVRRTSGDVVTSMDIADAMTTFRCARRAPGI